MSLLSRDHLTNIVKGKPVGEVWPYAGGSAREIEKHLRRAVAILVEEGLRVEADFDSYGSGYASYVHVFVEKSRTSSEGVEWITGLALYLCRLAPVGAYGPEERTRHATGGSSEFLEASMVYEVGDGWENEVSAIRGVLGELGFIFPSAEDLRAPIPSDLKIPTILGHETVFDVLFYWED